ncbi:MAG: hypothetical protein ISR58_13215 [Anaerolineales bacterium]|nr:hypothetical protein [Chloroflexota bacterium]MBL6982136.1 hypothetical protein [Anaerolineales bacterium]
MSNDEIKNNPSLSKLKKEAEQFRAFRKVWPILRPFAKMFGADTKTIDETLEKADELAKQVDEMTAIPDKFNDMFSDKGWILFDSMSLDVAKQAIEIAETDGIDTADEYLANYFSPDWVEQRMSWLKYIEGFRERFEIAQLALEDYKTGRYYASVLVTLSLIDGWVCELNIIDFQRHGFFSEKSQLVAWDSISAHPKGLAKLKEIFGKARMMTRSDEIRLPYRHGIVHGMDLGYNNKYVAAKCWATLFAVRDWVIKAARDELKPPELKPKIEKTLWESIESYQKVREQTEQLRQWQPRVVIIGQDIPTHGNTDEYPPNTPEQKMVEFLNYWERNNYGYMANCYAPMLEMKPVTVREEFEHRILVQYELLEIAEITSAVADAKVKVKLEKNDGEVDAILEFRIVCNTKDGDIAYIQTDETIWGITTWRSVE